MPTFYFEAVSASGKAIQDQIEAIDADHAEQKILQRGYALTRISLQDASGPEPNNAQSEKAQSEKAQSEKAQSEKAQSEKAQSEKAQSEKAQSEKAQSEKAQSEKAQSRPESLACQATLRVMDANANRALEGLRVVEDYARLVLDDGHLSELLKQMRHDVASAIERMPASSRLESRDTLADVGTQISTETENARASLRDVVAANTSRVQQSLRCLEEYGKTIDSGLACVIERIRYRFYTLAKAIAMTARSAAELDQATLYVLLDGQADPASFEKLVQSLIDAGTDVIQLRDKQRTDRDLVALARQLRAMTQGTGTRFIMNDRPDIAVLANADGVHLGQDELSVKDARAIVGPRALIGVSTHSIAQARQAVLEGANYIGVGPVFASRTKTFRELAGIEFVQAAAAEIKLPAFAIGGIKPDRIPALRAAGCQRIAVNNAITSASDPGRAARQLKAALAAG